MNIGLVTYASGDPIWHLAALRLKRQALATGRFTKISKYDYLKIIKIAPKEVIDFIKSNPRGGGYWIWKPIIILDFLKKNPEINAVFYMDSGCEINSNSESNKKLDELLLKASEYEIITFQMSHIEKLWSKNSLIQYMQVNSSVVESGQLLGGIHLMQRDFAINFCNRWLQIMIEDNMKFLSDDLDEELSYFMAHRHDQSIFSLLAKQSNNPLILDSDKEVYFEPYWQDYLNKPIWTARRKSLMSLTQNGIPARLWVFVERVISKMYRITNQ